jgi:hypothetical protein
MKDIPENRLGTSLRASARSFSSGQAHGVRYTLDEGT